MKRTISSYVIDLMVLEPFLAVLSVMGILLAPKGTFTNPYFLNNFLVGLIFGGATTLTILIGLWTFVFMRLPVLAIGTLAKVAWAVMLLVLPAFAVPVFYWRHLRHEFLPDPVATATP